MKKLPDQDHLNRQKITIDERPLLVSAGKSKKLAAMMMRQSAPILVPPPIIEKTDKFTDLKPAVAAELTRACTLIDNRIADIMASYPVGRCNKLFAIRYGTVTAIKALTIKAAFNTLNIDDKQINLRLIAGLDCHGNQLDC